MEQKKLRSSIPNALSITRLLLAGTLGILICIPHHLFIAQIIFIVAVITDKLDGTLARLWKVESEKGKKLESIIDPVFGCITAVYITVYLHFPVELFLLGFVLLCITALGRLFFTHKTGKLFYKKSPLTRYGTGFLYLFLAAYILNIPYREILIGPFVGYAIFGFFNYLRLIRNGIREHAIQL